MNLYNYFLEQCFNLLRKGGECGIVIPSGIYTDLGTKQLRELLFSETKITGLFGFENRKFIFEGVDVRFKFVVLTFRKGGSTEKFPAAFMRHSVEELEHFPRVGSLQIPVDLVRRSSPDSLSIMEFKNETDVHTAEKMMSYPLLGKHIEGNWNIELSNEFNMTTDSHLFKTKHAKGSLPLCEGKMIHQFTHAWGQPRYWLGEKEAAAALLASRKRAVSQFAKHHELDWDDDEDLLLDYKSYRLAFRDVAASTNERTMIMTILPPNRFCPHTMSLESVYTIGIDDGEIEPNRQLITNAARLFLCAVMNSFVVDAWLRRSVTNHLSFFFVYGVPIPRLTEVHPEFTPIVSRAARLVCTTSEFDKLARSVGLADHTAGATDPEERARLRAELDGMIAHLYGLTETEFAYVLLTFPLVAQSVKDAALDAFRRFAPVPDDAQLAANIRQGETDWQELKVAACWNPFTNRKDDSMRANVVEAVASFLNSREGGAVLIGVDAQGNVAGLDEDFRAADAKQPNSDGYERHLRQALNNRLGGEHAALYKFTFHHVGGKPVCRIRVEPSPKAVFLDGNLIIRDGNGKRKLTAQEAIAYQKHRWM